uniref:DUF3883 domain-containing protein n=1 Tax=candidate division WOR-3 bacterium TaxID=2052148 RepID=A0A7C2PA93_UNCW3
MEVEDLINKRVIIQFQFSVPVKVENLSRLGKNYKLTVRKPDGHIEEIILSESEIQRVEIVEDINSLVNAEDLLLLVESHRIRLAYSFDPYFAVSLSGIQTLPHQIEAVYGKMLPQPRLRFLLADDPGAGKTIMAGLYIKEMKLRNAVERILILVPANLKIQWQDELLRFFNEYFIIVDSDLDRQQAINIWQKENQVITSIDYAKQEDVRERIWQQNWDIVIVDEAHKCSAHTKRRSNRAPEREATKRYQLVEKLAMRANHLLLLTATPHYGDDDRFCHFLRLLDPDLFPEPHKYQDVTKRIRELIFPDKNNPWIIRRLKEHLCDINGRPLFTKRHAITISFKLSFDEYDLYQAVTDYLNRFLVVRGSGRLRQSIALTRTVFQRRLASSTFAIYKSLENRLKKQKEFLDELERASPKERYRLLEKRRGFVVDEEMDEGDIDEIESDRLIAEFSCAEEIDQLKEEIAFLNDLVNKAKTVFEKAPDTKLQALRECLERSEFRELRDGRGKLLIFTEHKDTLFYLSEHIRKWGYSVCEIHGGMDVYQRKRAQEEFRTSAQVCVATEAAGEGINLQFCHLVINYDIPWNPARLEQRMGRVHRIGQKRDVYIFNFVAEESVDGRPVIEGKILRKLFEKIDRMKAVLGEERVYDVIGEILSLNNIDLAEILRDAAYNAASLEEYLNVIDNISPEKLKEYEKMTGIALVPQYVDFARFQKQNYLVEEKRLMPEYVEKFFRRAAETVGLRVEKRADGLLKIPYVPAHLRSDELESVKRYGKPESEYKKVTFRKEDLEKDQHADAILLSPGHPLYAVVDEKLQEKLKNLKGSFALLQDLYTDEPYWLHLFEYSIVDESGEAVFKGLAAVKETKNGSYENIPPEAIHDLSPYAGEVEGLPAFDVEKVKTYLMDTVQFDKRREIQMQRQDRVRIIKEYLEKSFDERIYTVQKKIMWARAIDDTSPEDIESLKKELEDLEKLKKEKLENVEKMAIIRTGPISLVASFYVLPVAETNELKQEALLDKENSEKKAMEIVMDFERKRGWEPEDVSNQNLGFDIRSLGPVDPETGHREVRRIEVKGRKRGESIFMTANEWLKARQLKETYWLYVVWDPLDPNFEIVPICDPANKLRAKEIKAVSHYQIDAKEIENMKGANNAQ